MHEMGGVQSGFMREDFQQGAPLFLVEIVRAELVAGGEGNSFCARRRLVCFIAVEADGEAPEPVSLAGAAIEFVQYLRRRMEEFLIEQHGLLDLGFSLGFAAFEVEAAEMKVGERMAARQASVCCRSGSSPMSPCRWRCVCARSQRISASSFTVRLISSMEESRCSRAEARVC